jgi:hypothetical protein
MEAIRSSETSVLTRATCHNIAEDTILRVCFCSEGLCLKVRITGTVYAFVEQLLSVGAEPGLRKQTQVPPECPPTAAQPVVSGTARVNGPVMTQAKERPLYIKDVQLLHRRRRNTPPSTS